MTTGNDIHTIIINTIEKYEQLSEYDSVLIALSGGPDSVALLHILYKLRKKLSISLCAVYINHRLRPRAAIKEAEFCEALCKKFAIPFFYEEININKLAEREKAGIEETARKYRYQILDMVANREGCHKIAVGHHRDDRAETILFNLFRGSGRSGLIGMPASRGKIIRPLYDLRREDIRGYLRLHRLKYMVDKSNLSRRFTRNRIRLDILPLIEKKISEGVAENIIRFSEILNAEEQHLGHRLEQSYKKVTGKTPGNKIKLDLEGFLKYDLWLRRRILFRLLNEAGLAEVCYADIDRILDLAGIDTNSRMTIRQDLAAEKYGEWLYVYQPGMKIKSYGLNVPGKIRLEYPQVQFEIEFVKSFNVKEVKQSKNAKAYIDAEKISPPLYLAGLKQGARFHPFGRVGSKKAGDFLTDKKYPRPLRDELPVVYDKEGIVWLAGVEIDDRVKIDNKTEKMVKLEVGCIRIKGKAV